MPDQLSFLLQHKVVAIIRGMPSTDAAAIAEALYKGGIRLVEITLNSPDALGVIAQLSDVYNNKMLIGAGTVLTAQEASDAISAGAEYIISPMLDADVIKTTLDKGKISIPGAYTPTEIVQAHRCGAHIIKVFPALSADYIKSVLAPLHHLKLMPTGGVDVSNIKEYQNAGAVAFGIGSALVNSKEKVTGTYLQKLEEKARQFVAAIQ